MSLYFSHILIILSASTGQVNYPHPNLLIETSELAKAKVGTVSILDVRSEKKYDAGHIPGAVRVDHDEWAKGFVQHPDKDTWAKWIGDMGIRGADEPVVVYSDDVMTSKTRPACGGF
jgi:3-mercaptopyruvate sulfurtransferase SseA